jgi:hypothetical protein
LQKHPSGDELGTAANRNHQLTHGASYW